MPTQESPAKKWLEGFDDYVEEASEFGALNMERQICVGATRCIMRRVGTSITDLSAPFPDKRHFAGHPTVHRKTMPLEAQKADGSWTKLVLGETSTKWYSPGTSRLKRLTSRPYLCGYVYVEDLNYERDMTGNTRSMCIAEVQTDEYKLGQEAVPLWGTQAARSHRLNVNTFAESLEEIIKGRGSQVFEGFAAPTMADIKSFTR